MGVILNPFTGELEVVKPTTGFLTKSQADTYYYPLSTNPAGYLTSASLTGYVPYTGANANVNLGAYKLLSGTSASLVSFPTAQGIFSNGATGLTSASIIGLVGEGVSDGVNSGKGLLGIGMTSGAGSGIGISGYGKIGASADTGSAYGVIGYSTDTHAGGSNYGVYGQAQNGNVNTGAAGIGYTNGVSSGTGVYGTGNVTNTADTGISWGLIGVSVDAHAGGINIGVQGSAQNGALNYSFYGAAGDIYNAGNAVITGTLGVGATTVSSLTDSGLTSGRVTYAGTSGILQDSANLTFTGKLLTLSGGTATTDGLATTGALTITGITGAPSGGSPGLVGSAVSINGGTGGGGANHSSPGPGGAITLQAGMSGQQAMGNDPTGSFGGNASLYAGAGADAPGSGIGFAFAQANTGGTANLSAGNGGSSSAGTAGNTAGNGGDVVITAGTGGSATGTAPLVGGSGGNVNIIAGLKGAGGTPTDGVLNFKSGTNVLLSATSAKLFTFLSGSTLSLAVGTISTDTTTGLIIVGSTTQKLGFFGHAPAVQQTAVTDLGVALSNLGIRAAGTAYPITTSGAAAFTGTFNTNAQTVGGNITIAGNDILLGATSGNPGVTRLIQTQDQVSGGTPANLQINGGSSCFASGTKISMADNSFKNIEDIAVGDIVKADVGDGKVTKLFHHTPDEMKGEYLLLINGKLKVTINHKIYCNGSYIEAEKIEIGDELSDETVVSIEKIEGRVPTYNFEVETYHTYFAEGILVHNTKGATVTGGNISIYGGTGYAGGVNGAVCLAWNGSALTNKVTVGLGPSSATALLTIAAGTATASTAPLKFVSGTVLTNPETGAVEYDGTHLFASPAGALRERIHTGWNASGTLTAGTTTTVTDARAKTTSTILLQATSLGIIALTPYISAKNNGSFVITTLTAAGTETFDYTIIN
jgi:hypothetical protein